MPKITIDGIELDVDDGLNVIQAAAVAGIEIPPLLLSPLAERSRPVQAVPCGS